MRRKSEGQTGLVRFTTYVVGAVGVIATLIAIFKQRGVEGIWPLALLPAAVACFYVLSGIGKLKRTIAKQDSAGAIQTVKSSAKRVPIWLTVVAWSMLVAAFILFIAGRQN